MRLHKPGMALLALAAPQSLRAKLAWASFDWALRPFSLLVLTYVFAPFFANFLAPDPVAGQSLWGLALGGAGLIVALAAPPLGAVADAAGRKKPWIAGFGALLALGASLLWFTEPGRALSLSLAILGVMAAVVGSECAIVFHNALMPSLAPLDRIGRLSAMGWAVGSLGGFLGLLLMLALFLANPGTGRTMIGLAPVLALDATTHAAARLVGPLTAAWFLVFVAPMFLAMPDDAPAQAPTRAALREGLRAFGQTLALLPRSRPLATFLLANMIFMDGLGVIVAFGGIYATAVFGWGAQQLTALGIVIVSVGGVAALALGRLIDLFGSKRMIIACLIGLLIASLGILGTTRESILFGVPVAPPTAGGALFGSIGEKTLFAFAALVGACAGPLFAAARTHLAHLAPPGRAAQYFGYFALSGRVTAFVGPTLVGLITAATGSQRLGIGVCVPMLALGLSLMAGRERRESDRVDGAP